MKLHDLVKDHAGIVVCTVDPYFTGQALRVQEAIAALPSLPGRLIRVNRPGEVVHRPGLPPEPELITVVVE